MNCENSTTPKSVNLNSKPSLFCPGCGQSITLKHLGFVIDELGIKNKTTIGIDIGCSLLAWDYYNIDTIQTHHGRTVPVMVGYKMARKDRTVIAIVGDGGAYAIGLQSLIHAAFRNNPICVIVINNTEYSMTGGQMAPTTIANEITSTSPSGKNEELFGGAFLGPEFISQIANKNSYIARASVSNPDLLEKILSKALKNQEKNRSFSLVEVLSICPTNWKTNAKESFQFLSKLEKIYHIGEIIKNGDRKNK